VGHHGEQEEGALASNVVTIGWDGGWGKKPLLLLQEVKKL